MTDYYIEEDDVRNAMCRDCKLEICKKALGIECPLEMGDDYDSEIVVSKEETK